MPFKRGPIYSAINRRRAHQDTKWGTEFDDRNTANDWVSYICTYASKASKMKVTVAEFQKSMLDVAALAVAAIEAVERNGGLPPRHYDDPAEPTRPEPRKQWWARLLKAFTK